MSHNDTWMPLYIGDYLGDTMELDGAQHGAYLLLLMYYWRNGPLPTEDAKLAQIARTEIRVWKKLVGPVVRPFFQERDGRLHQKRADIELAKAEGVSAKRRAAAGARWNGHNDPPPNGASSDANAHANASPLADQVDMQTACTHAGASLSQSQLQEEAPPVGPHRVGTGTPARPGTPPARRTNGTNLRAEGTNPRETGDNTRANGTNPRATGTNPRQKPHRNGFVVLERELERMEAEAAAADVVEWEDYRQRRRIGIATDG